MTPEILYIDLGLHKGKELEAFVNMAEFNEWEYVAVGIEAAHKWFKYNEDKFKNKERVAILDFAITSKMKPVKLFHDAGDGQGNSIYRSKNNVTDQYEIVHGCKLSDLISEMPSWGKLNILRFNIEGAEWDLMHDLANTGLHEKFDLFLGEPNGEDIAKCGMDQKAYLQLLKDNDINIFPWCLERPGYIDLERWIKEYFT